MVARFKEKFPSWYEVNWSQVYIEIEEDEVYVHRLIDGDIYNGLTIKLDARDFADRLNAAIEGFRTVLPAKGQPE